MSIYHIFVFDPLYNGLILLLDVFTWMDAGVAVILFTIIVKLILFPLSKKAIVTQVRMKELEPELNALKETHKADKQAQSMKVMELYKKRGVNPFSSFFLLLIQLPILFALYGIFIRSGLPAVDQSILYSFVSAPTINMNFLGFLDISKASVFLSLCAAIAQFFQLQYSLSSAGASQKKDNPSKNALPGPADIAQNMGKQMKYILPVIIFVFSYQATAVIALYWTVSSLFTLGQELVVRRKLAHGDKITA